ncbi:MAG: hypothetical protein F6K52_06665 [Moorea sp. SIO3H5]|nr:hypothetical protein [Moorena sp. SIO3H5]
MESLVNSKGNREQGTRSKEQGVWEVWEVWGEGACGACGEMERWGEGGM